MNALENENLDVQGQVNNNVGQDEATKQEESENDWKTQAKYFQSEKDKLYAENQKLKEYEQVGQMLESRPDVVEKMTNYLKSGTKSTTSERVQLTQDEFDPWEAYNDPSSKSYQFRQQELQDTINQSVQGQMAGMQKQVGVSQLKSDLTSKGLNDNEIQSFMDFASKNPAEYGIDGAINMWKSVTQQSTASNQNPNPLDVIRQNQTVPQQAGILNGEQPVRASDDDTMWKGIVGASRVANKLP